MCFEIGIDIVSCCKTYRSNEQDWCGRTACLLAVCARRIKTRADHACTSKRVALVRDASRGRTCTAVGRLINVVRPFKASKDCRLDAIFNSHRQKSGDKNRKRPLEKLQHNFAYGVRHNSVRIAKNCKGRRLVQPQLSPMLHGGRSCSFSR